MDNLKTKFDEKAFDDTLIKLYGSHNLDAARRRCETVISGFTKAFGNVPEALFSAPGRTELGGNHTDHQHARTS